MFQVMTRYNITESLNYTFILMQAFTIYTSDLIYKRPNELSNSLFWKNSYDSSNKNGKAK